jgi:glutathione S-transferase
MHGRKYVAGGELSIADLALWYLLEYIRDNGFGAALANAKSLNEFEQRIAKSPRIAEYLKSPRRAPFTPLPV